MMQRRLRGSASSVYSNMSSGIRCAETTRVSQTMPKASLRVFGGKAANYSVLYRTPGVPIKNGFAIPIYFYDQFMQANGFYARIDGLLADPLFTTDAATRDAALKALQTDMRWSPRWRSSTGW